MSGTLNHSPAVIIQKLLCDLGIGTLPSDAGAWPVYATSIPDSPDPAIAVLDATGDIQGSTQPDGEIQEFYGIQITVRHTNHDDGWAKANDIVDQIDRSVSQQTVSMTDTTGTATVRYLVHAITRRSNILPLGTDVETSKRSIFAIRAIVSLWQYP